MKELQYKILATLIYHDLFDYPLKESEIEKFLIEIKPGFLAVCRDPGVKPEEQKINRVFTCLKQLIKKKLIKHDKQYYYLSGRKDIVELRKERELISKEKIKIAKITADILKLIPWIKMIGITGALSMNNAKKDEDIDLLIITSKNRLWLARLLAVLILEILGKRRRPDAKDEKNTKDKICLNMFLDESSLQLTKEKQNLFTGHEVVQMKPIFNRDQTYEQFLFANLWVRNYLPNSLEIRKFMEIHGNSLLEEKTTNFLISTNFNKFLCFLEKLAFQLQIKYMQNRLTTEQVNLHSALFHPKDISKEVLLKYEQAQRRMI